MSKNLKLEDSNLWSIVKKGHKPINFDYLEKLHSGDIDPQTGAKVKEIIRYKPETLETLDDLK